MQFIHSTSGTDRIPSLRGADFACQAKWKRTIRLCAAVVLLLFLCSSGNAADLANGKGRTTLPDQPKPSDPIAGKEHWAFRSLSHRRPKIDSDWVRSPIDEFVLFRQRGAGLRPSPDADPRDLVRRIYFQLTGLPPTPQQVIAYLQDDLPDATERLVDRLLRSPQFGERWGRHWLDLARYADSNGLDENFLFREAWRYRNWVIDAVNADVPFDRFLLDQIAGDLLPFESIEQRDQQRIAAGFLVVGPRFYSETTETSSGWKLPMNRSIRLDAPFWA